MVRHKAQIQLLVAQVECDRLLIAAKFKEAQVVRDAFGKFSSQVGDAVQKVKEKVGHEVYVQKDKIDRTVKSKIFDKAIQNPKMAKELGDAYEEAARMSKYSGDKYAESGGLEYDEDMELDVTSAKRVAFDKWAKSHKAEQKQKVADAVKNAKKLASGAGDKVKGLGKEVQQKWGNALDRGKSTIESAAGMGEDAKKSLKEGLDQSAEALKKSPEAAMNWLEKQGRDYQTVKMLRENLPGSPLYNLARERAQQSPRLSKAMAQERKEFEARVEKTIERLKSKNVELAAKDEATIAESLLPAFAIPQALAIGLGSSEKSADYGLIDLADHLELGMAVLAEDADAKTAAALKKMTAQICSKLYEKVGQSLVEENE